MDSLTVTVNPQAAAVSESGNTLGSQGKRIGRPPKYNNCLDLLADIDDYFDTCDAGRMVTIRDKRGQEHTEHKPIPYTVGALGLHLELYSDRWTEELGARGEDFSRCLKYARNRIESQREVGLLDGSSNVIGSIFWLKARAGWRDTPEVADSRGITVVLNGEMFAAPKLVGEGSTALRGSVPLTLDVSTTGASMGASCADDADD